MGLLAECVRRCAGTEKRTGSVHMSRRRSPFVWVGTQRWPNEVSMLISRHATARRHDVATTTFFTVLMAGLLLGACDGSEDPVRTGGGAPANPGGGGMNPGTPAATFDLQGCVVSVLATDCGSGLPVPHEIELL